MTRPRSASPPLDRAVASAHDLGDIFDKGESWVRERLPQLEAEGFPPYDELLDGWNLCRVIAWFEARTETAPVRDDGIQNRLEAMQNGR